MRLAHQLHPSRRPERGSDVALLMRKGIKGDVQKARQIARLRLTRQKTRHIRAFHGARPRARADGADGVCRELAAERIDQLRQTPDMRKQRVRLPQAEFAGLHVQKA